MKKKKKTEEQTAAAAQAAKSAGDASNAAFEPGVVGNIASLEHLEALLQRSKSEGFGVVLDFTAGWCKPCQAIKPRFKALAGEYPSHSFWEVDADELDDVTARYEVMGLPTFQIFKNGERVAKDKGGDEAKMVKLMQEHLGAPQKAGEGKKSS